MVRKMIEGNEEGKKGEKRERELEKNRREECKKQKR